jgi:hypothetical protein
MKLYKHTSIVKMNNINDLDLKFKYQTLNFKLKNKLMTSHATKISDTESLLQKDYI